MPSILGEVAMAHLSRISCWAVSEWGHTAESMGLITAFDSDILSVSSSPG